ncbi:MAG: tetratricopeptide repeat protein [Candidatus Azobacteroides sp.]|nr:tetratricopeptide repeat protein [Candidatus Azobacteroides sp.]
MKNKKTYIFNCVLILALFSVFSSCTSIYNFAIEIRQPAKVTFPTDVSRIVLVNNAASPENSDFGTECFVNQKETDCPFAIDFDSAHWASVSALAYGINSEKFFSKVMIYNVPLREDNAALEIRPITQEVAQKIYDVTDADAIISVEKGLFRYSQAMAQLPTGYINDPYNTFLNVKTLALFTFSVYLKDRENPLATFSLQDSLYLKSEYVDSDSINLFRTIPNILINEVAGYIGEDAVSYFVPSWQTVDRFLFTSYNSRMKEALAYAKANKWITAENIWLELYNSQNSLKSQAYLAQNLAVAFEMQDDLDKALEWVQKAETLFKQDNELKNQKEINRISSYISALTERINNDSLLNKQFGIE